jgi:hypothetical protein
MTCINGDSILAVVDPGIFLKADGPLLTSVRRSSSPLPPYQKNPGSVPVKKYTRIYSKIT